MPNLPGVIPVPGSIVPPLPTTKPERPFQIFSAGEYRGKQYPREFLTAAVMNFEKFQRVDDPIGFPKPPAVIIDESDVKAAGVALGHEDTRINALSDAGADDLERIARALLDKTDIPAAGWVSRLFMVGDGVFVELEGVPVELAAACNAGLYRYCSAEWYDDYVGPSGTHYGPMLRRVAILGGELPALKFLGRLPPFVFSDAARSGISITCFSESFAMSHDELILALSAFIPNVAAMSAAGVSDDTLAIMLKCFQDNATPPNPLTDSMNPGDTFADPSPGMKTPGQIATCGESGGGAVPNGAFDGLPTDGLAKGTDGKDNLSPAYFSELKKLVPQLASLSRTMQTQIAASRSALEIIGREAKEKEKAEVTAFCERMVRERRLEPHELSAVDASGKPKPSKVEFLLALDAKNKTFVFGEKQLSPREIAMAEIENRTPRTFSEKLPDAFGRTNEPFSESRRVQLLAASEHGKAILMKEAKEKGLKKTADGRLVIS